MKVSIYSLTRVLFQSEAQLLGCNTAVGEVTILDHHRPLIGALEKGTVKIVDTDGKEAYHPITGGFLKVGSHNDVTLIVDE